LQIFFFDFSEVKPILSHISYEESKKQLKIIMDRHLRHSTEALHEKAGVPLIEDFSQRIVENFIDKNLFSENPLILGLIDS
jgi:hypothetical protein